MSNSHHNKSYETRGYEAVIVSVVATLLTLLILVARIWTRRYSMGSEDWTILVSYAFSVALTILIGIEVVNGQGRHLDTINAHELQNLYKAFWASVPIYQTSLTITKVSILLQYLRVFVGQQVRRGIMVLMAITVVYGTWSVASTTFSCAPISYFWDRTLPGGHCINLNAVWFANASLNIVTDVAIFVLPIPVLKQLHLPQRQKWGLMGVFALGAFVCLTSILRLRALYDLSASNDVTYDNGPAVYWSSLEVNIGVICASLPTLRKAISRLMPRVFNSTGAGRSRNQTAGQATASGFRRFPGLSAGEASTSQMRTHISSVVGEEVGGSPGFGGGSVSASSAASGWDSKVGVEMEIMREEEEVEDEDGEEEVGGNGGIRVLTVTTQKVVWQGQPREDGEEGRFSGESSEEVEKERERKVRESV